MNQYKAEKTVARCEWCGHTQLYQEYHDQQWGRPELDSLKLFKQLCLEGQQAGLSWITILRKRATYEKAYDHFDPERIAKYNENKVNALLQDTGIVRNRLKVKSIIRNAKAYLDLEQQGCQFSDFLWRFVDNKTIINTHLVHEDIPVTSPESDAMSKALKKAGFNFVGSTICYAFMQAVGMVNDHVQSCHAYSICCDEARR